MEIGKKKIKASDVDWKRGRRSSNLGELYEKLRKMRLNETAEFTLPFPVMHLSTRIGQNLRPARYNFRFKTRRLDDVGLRWAVQKVSKDERG